MSVVKNIINIIICDKQADQNTEFDVIFLKKNATRNIPKIVPQKIEPIILTSCIKFSNKVPKLAKTIAIIPHITVKNFEALK